MPSWLPSIPYPPAGDGYWSPVTSTLNWCEEDYYASFYCAEVVNCLTNLWFVYLGYKGIINTLANNHDRVFLYAFGSYTFIGLGSFAFHATLKYPMQLLDELSMIYTTCFLAFAIFSYGRSTGARVALAGLTASIAILVTGYYHYLGDPVFHQNVFALLTAIVFFRSYYAMELTLKSSRRKGNRNLDAAERVRTNKRNEEILKTMYFMISIGLCSVAAGFGIWNLDNIFCSTLRRWRRDIGLPLGILLEGHGWWHLLTGIAEFYNIVWSIWLRYCIEGTQNEVFLVWPSLLSMPYVERKKLPVKAG